MKIAVNALLLVLAAVFGLTLGFIFRAKPRSHGIRDAKSAVVSKTTRLFNPATRPLSVASVDSSPLATKLERDLSMSSGVTRWLYWLDALEKAAPQDFPRLARLAQGNSTALRFAAARWVEVAPRHMFDSIVANLGNNGFPANELAQTLFSEWTRRDPKAVVEALDSSESLKSHGWKMNVAGTIFNNDVELGLQVMSKWNVDNYIPSMKGVAKWAAEDPRHAAEFTYENQIGVASREMMKTIGMEWAKIDPAAALEYANTKPGELGSVLAREALKEWAARDLNAAADWLANSQTPNRDRLASAFVESWAKQDAAGSLEWCALNLTGSALASAVGGVLTGLSQKDLAAAQGLVANMAPSSARAAAAAAVADKAFPDSSSQKPVPPEAVAWLKQLDPESRKSAFDQVYWRWVSLDPQGFADFLKMPGNEKIPDHMYANVARTLARRDPSEALAWAVELPAKRAIETGRAVFAEWRRSQPEPAMKWLNSLPDADPRRQPFFETAIRSLVQDAQAAQQLAAMNAAERAAARKVIESMPLPDERRAKLLGTLSAR